MDFADTEPAWFHVSAPCLCGLGGAVCRKQGNERRELQGVIGAGRSVTARPPRQSGLRDACALGDLGLGKTAINQAFE